MLRSVHDWKGFTIQATDGEIGHVDQFFFDDEHWTIRYLVVDTGGWLAGRRVLISPIALGETDWPEQRLHVKLTRQQVENSPDIDLDRPVSRLQEKGYYQYYGWPAYWAGPALWGPGPYPLYYAPEERHDIIEPDIKGESGDRHLRSVREVTGYAIQARDGDIGHVEDFLLDERDWSIRYLIVDTKNWLPGKKVLVAPTWISGVHWDRSNVSVDLTRSAIEQAPEYDESTGLTREYETRLYNHYSRPAYWHTQSEDRAAA